MKKEAAAAAKKRKASRRDEATADAKIDPAPRQSKRAKGEEKADPIPKQSTKAAPKRAKRDVSSKPAEVKAVDPHPRQSTKVLKRDKRVTASLSQADVPKNAKISKPQTDRATDSKPEADPEFFEDKRNLEDLWREVFPVGTEWEQLDTLYQFKWDFSNLEKAFDEGGDLHGKRVYLFGCTEPQFVTYKGDKRIVYIPAVVAVVSPFPPSDKIGIKSVQREVEEILPMRQMKMDWVPYVPLEYRDSPVDKLDFQIFILTCTQRRTALKHLKIEQLKKYEYCLPYFYQPFNEDELEQSTIVQIMFPAEPAPIVCEYDWELDEYEEMADKFIEAEALSADQKDAFIDFLRQKVREGKRANREAREAKKRAIEEMSEDTRAAYQNIKFYKFYPVQTPDTPDISCWKASYINRYYGKAHVIV